MATTARPGIRRVRGVSYVYASASYSDSFQATTGFGESDGRGAGGAGNVRPVTSIANC